MPTTPEITHSFVSRGPHSASLDATGQSLAIDFLDLADSGKALRLFLPVERLATIRKALDQLAREVDNPNSSLQANRTV